MNSSGNKELIAARFNNEYWRSTNHRDFSKKYLKTFKNSKQFFEKALMITNVMSYDGIDMWSNSLKEIIEWMPSDDLAIVDTGLELFATLFSRVIQKYRNEKILPE